MPVCTACPAIDILYIGLHIHQFFFSVIMIVGRTLPKGNANLAYLHSSKAIDVEQHICMTLFQRLQQ